MKISGPKKRRTFTVEFKFFIVDKVLKEGRSIRSLSLEFNIDCATIRRWRNLYLNKKLTFPYTTFSHSLTLVLLNPWFSI
jgi:transposase-like protein